MVTEQRKFLLSEKDNFSLPKDDDTADNTCRMLLGCRKCGSCSVRDQRGQSERSTVGRNERTDHKQVADGA